MSGALPAQVAAHFGLQREPFSIAPDPHFLFLSDKHREALAHLLFGVAGGGGFVLLTGEIGAGKTTVCRCLLDQLPADCNTAYIVNPKLSVVELLQTVCDEFGVTVASAPAAPTVKDHIDPLNRFVLDAHAAGRNNLLIIDEAQNLSADVLEQLRLLTNLETAERKLLQIVLIGQPELRDMLARPELQALAQRIIARCHLPALDEAETRQYVAHRLAVAGLQGEAPFDAAALRRIHRLSGGVPRRINLLCGRALLGAYAQGRLRVDRPTVEQAAREVFGAGAAAAAPRRRRAWMAVAAGAAGLVAAATLVGMGLLRPGGHAPAASAAAAARAAASPASPVDDSAAAGASPGVAGPAPGAAPARGPSTTPEGRAQGQPANVNANASASASAATAAASSAAAAAPAAVAIADEARAWRELAALWGETLAEGDTCQAAARQQLQCFRNVSGLALIRQLGRPGIVTLLDDSGRRGHALLLGVADDRVTLGLDGGTRSVTLAELSRLWRGDFATLWRTPPGWRDGAGGPGPIVPALAAWLAPRLPARPGAPEAAASAPSIADLRAQVQAFQLAQGLKPDGLIGPLTLMLLNRASGVAEPRLSTD